MTSLQRRTGATFAILVLLSGIILTALWFGLALGQVEPVGKTAIVVAAAKLEATGEDIAPLGPGVWLKRAYKDGLFQQNGDALDKLMSAQGWHHSDQEGSGRIYTKGNSKLMVICRMHSIHYQVCVAHGLQ